MGDFCVDYINRQRTSYMNFIIYEPPVDHLNSASENTETQENLERKSPLEYRLNLIIVSIKYNRSLQMWHIIYTRENKVSSMETGTPRI